MKDWRRLADQMVREQILARGVHDERVLQALREVPRHRFVPPALRDQAYADAPLPIGSGQTISQPYIVAYMTALLGLRGDEKVLEVGTGSGYQAAILARLAREVHTIERLPHLAEQARQRLADLGLGNVTVHVGDGSQGLPALAPFDAILVAAAAPAVPQPLLEQLTIGGKLVLPVGSRGFQRLERWLRTPKGWEREALEPVAFVPLRGEHGWGED